jgi:two-component system chemotaxis response regulator CheY
MAANGVEAVDAVRIALQADAPYDLICLDIMMPDMDGHRALTNIRALEGTGGLASLEGAKIVMTTAVSDSESIRESIRERCDYFLIKPIQREKLIAVLRAMALI